ncbi:FAD-dependent oxidoreductase [Sulfitobacter sp.]|uniref:FAD-dependent oxidoreductase n=1 Tax=Sulfitobacter sp. TaxID=1903071 RepID=UPI003002C7DE
MRYPALTGARTADVVVVGVGFTGLSAAWRLLQLDPELKVTLLDAWDIVEGLAGRKSGFVIDLPHDLASQDYAGRGDETSLIALNRTAIAFAQAVKAEYEIDPAYVDPVGKINGAASETADAQNRNYATHLAALGKTCEHIDGQSVTELTGSRHNVSGLYTPGTLMLQSAGYI